MDLRKAKNKRVVESSEASSTISEDFKNEVRNSVLINILRREYAAIVKERASLR